MVDRQHVVDEAGVEPLARIAAGPMIGTNCHDCDLTCLDGEGKVAAENKK
jgi:hypothetical protein